MTGRGGVDPLQNVIKAQPNGKCYLCGTPGDLLHKGLVDRVEDAPGVWNFRRCASSQCQLIWIDPVPFPDEVLKAYARYYTHDPYTFGSRVLHRLATGYAGLTLGYADKVPLADRILALLCLVLPFLRLRNIGLELSELPSSRRGHLLEVGCGGGHFLATMDALGWDVVGVDVDPVAVERAKSRGVRVHKGRLEDQSFPNDSFDVIVMAHVIEHVPNPLKLLAECKRILRKGGRLIVITPNAISLSYLVFKSSWLALDVPRHLFLFSPETLQITVERSGLLVKSLRTTARSAESIWLASTSIARVGKNRESANFLLRVIRRVRAMLFHFRMVVALKSRPDVGDEVVLVATRPIA